MSKAGRFWAFLCEGGAAFHGLHPSVVGGALAAVREDEIIDDLERRWSEDLASPSKRPEPEGWPIDR